MRRFIAWVFLLALSLAAAPAEEFSTAASWIWYPERPAVEGSGQTRCLRKVLRLEQPPVQATVRVRVDDRVVFLVNSAPAPEPLENGPGGAVYDLAGRLQAGENVLAFTVTNAGGPGGLILTGTLRWPDGREQRLHSDTSFRAALAPAEGWERPGFDDTGWPAARVVGHAYTAPWYDLAAYDMEPFIEPADRERWRVWRAALTRIPAGLADEPARRARFETIQGSPALLIDGQPRPALAYRGTVDPMTAHGRCQVAHFRDAGVHVYAAYMPLDKAWEDRPGRFDALDDRLRAYLSVDPEAQIILLLRLVPPESWMDAHPDELVRYAKGDDYNSADESQRVRRPSFASALWQREAAAVWQAAIEHLEAQPWGRRVIGYHPCYGIYAEWHYYGSWSQQMPDTGPAMTGAFRSWLRQRYGNDAALQHAWGDAAVTLSTAAVPGVAPREAADLMGLRDPLQRSWVMDYYRCQQAITADDIEMLCRIAKEATGERVLCGAFYGYFEGVLPQTQGGHLELPRLLQSPHVDYFAAPYSYSHRRMGDDGRTRAITDAFTAAGKMHFIEADTRTHLHPHPVHGRVDTMAQSVAAIRREVATALTHGSALWWTDFGADGTAGWYDDPELMREIAGLMKLAERRLQRPRQRQAEVLVVADLESCYLLPDNDTLRTHYRLVGEVVGELYRCGVPFDTVLLSQFADLDLEPYRLVVMLNPLMVTPALRPMVAKAVAGRAVLWLWAPGVSDGQRLDPALVTDLTGFRVGAATVAPLSVRCVAGQDLLASVPVTTAWSLTPKEVTPVAGFADPANWYNPRSAKAMATAYQAYAWQAAGEGLRWDIATSDAWTDIHLKAAVPTPSAGFVFEIAGEGHTHGVGLRLVIKDADAAEFVAPSLPLSARPERHALPLAGFVKAPWSKAAATAPRFPLTGFKVVVDGLGGQRAVGIHVRALGAATGAVTRQDSQGYAVTSPGAPVLSIADPSAQALGHDPVSGAVVLASRGDAGRRQVFSTVPGVPRQILAALIDDAGVLRYVSSEAVVVRADSALVALHTAVGGPVELRLPAARRVRDAITGETLGEGARLPLTLLADSTMLLELE